MTRVVLASASPARLDVLRRAGLAPDVVVSGVDESVVDAGTPEDMVRELARLKGEAVLATLADEAEDVVLFACDSLLDLHGRAIGKPGSATAARRLWEDLRGSTAVLATGHFVAVRDAAGVRSETRVATTTVRFADPTNAELDDYAASGEPERVAGGFTIDGRGAAFVAGVAGDPHTVVGISPPLLRTMLADLGVGWTTLWASQ